MSPLVVLLALPQQAHAANLTVPGQYPTLQGAIDAAAASDVIILNTTVNEDVTIQGKTITIRGATTQNGVTGTMIVQNSTVDIQGMTLAGGTRTTSILDIIEGVYCDVYGPTGIVVTGNSSDVTLDGVEMFCFNQAIVADGGAITINDSDISFNAGINGGAMAVSDTDVTIDDSSFTFNVGTNGGAIYAYETLTPGDTTFHVQRSTFESNITAGGEGGAIYASMGTVEMWSNRFNNNFNLVYFTPGSAFDDETITASELIVGLGEGGGIYVKNPADTVISEVDVWNNTFCGNIADRGAGVYVDNIEGAKVYNNRFAENLALHYGGGLYTEADDVFDDDVHIVNNTFLYNRAGLTPLEEIVVIGGGGSVALVNTKSDFRNNIVAHTTFGAGIMGVADDLGVSIDGQEDPDWTIGDLLNVTYNDFFLNCDVQGCEEGNSQDFSGDMTTISLSPTNIHLDPFPTYFGDSDFNCLPDAFYPEFESPVVRSGDAISDDTKNRFDENFSDMGSYGGQRADVLDRDGDGYENIYDCNDEDVPGANSVFPGAPELCDFFDNNCNEQVDEGFTTQWYTDEDGDGYGDVNDVQGEISCDDLSTEGKVLNREDCNDLDADENPGNTEICDGLDNDCDGVADGGLEFIPLWYDGDIDGYGAGATRNGCPSQDPNNMGPNVYFIVDEETGIPTLSTGGYVTNGLDCNDFSADISPGALEACNAIDDNCDDLVDNDTNQGTNFYPDGDGDGFGSDDPLLTINACPDSPPTGETPYVTVGGDCQDDNPAVNPGVDEVCDSVDNDCKNGADKGAIDAPTVFQDADEDGFGNPAQVSQDCVPPVGYTATVGTDCDDNDPNVLECAKGCEGCQSNPTPGGLLSILVGMGALAAGRRRKDA